MGGGGGEPDEDHAWVDVGLPPAEFRPSRCLEVGQCFHWKSVGDATWLGVPFGRQPLLLHEGTETTWARTLDGSPEPLSATTLARLRKYLSLNEGSTLPLAPDASAQPSLKHLYSEWESGADEELLAAMKANPGSRTLQLEPLEGLCSFICSSNNNVARITLMVDRLRSRFGTPLGSPPAGLRAISSSSDAAPRNSAKPHTHIQEFNERQCLFAFPTVEALAAAPEEDFRSLGLGYRAGYVKRTAEMLQAEGGLGALEALRFVPRREAEKQLRRYMGVGPKVAACVALLALGHADAVPIDVHIARLAAKRFAPPALAAKLAGKGSSISAGLHEEVGDVFRERFGKHAGWVQLLLFSAERAAAGPSGR